MRYGSTTRWFIMEVSLVVVVVAGVMCWGCATVVATKASSIITQDF
jgi:hypothetical protein